MTLGDGIRRNIAVIDPAERVLLRDAFVELNRRRYPGHRDDPLPGGVTSWFNQDEILRRSPADAVGDIEFQETDLTNREAAINEGRVDAVVVTSPITDARKQQVDFAGPNFMAGLDLMVKTGETAIRGVSDLNGKSLCLTLTNPFTEPNVKGTAPQAEIIVMSATAQCSGALAGGRVDAVPSANPALALHAPPPQRARPLPRSICSRWDEADGRCETTTAPTGTQTDDAPPSRRGRHDHEGI